jgi:uncharacterized protein (UPF0261 family)
MPESSCILLLGTCDTKLQELLYTRDQITKTDSNIKVLLVDVGRTPSANPSVDIPSSKVLSHLETNGQTTDISSLGRGEVISKMIEACTVLVKDLYTSKSIHGIVALGGTGGTSLAANVMRAALPIGFPKLIVSTVASGDTSSYVGESDITLMPSIVDIAGLNSVLRTILENAAAAIAAMTKLSYERSINPHPESGSGEKKKLRIAITMFGVTTPAVTTAMEYLSSLGHEVFTFRKDSRLFVLSPPISFLFHPMYAMCSSDFLKSESCSSMSPKLSMLGKC